jgi:hypothetical protein
MEAVENKHLPHGVVTKEDHQLINNLSENLKAYIRK